MSAANQQTLQIENLKVKFEGKQPFQALQDVSLRIEAGKTLALIGQSGSGKSVTALALMGLLPKNTTVSGKIIINGKLSLEQLSAQEWIQVRGKEVAMVFQEPMTALNPVKTCGYQLIESIRAHQQLSTKEAKALALQWFEKVKLPTPAALLKRYPHQLSGGQKQRVMIAMAMCNHPALLIADEPTTALDVTVQQEIILLMKELQEAYKTSILFITHDIALARTIADDFVMMEKGRVIQQGYPQSVPPPDFRSIGTFESKPLLKIENVSVQYQQETKWWDSEKNFLTAVNQVSFELYKGETLGLVGESGCGKSTLSKSILGLQDVSSGAIMFEDVDITTCSKAQWRGLRKDIQIIFQDPYASLNQRIKIGDALAEPMLIHGLSSRKNVDKHVDELLAMVQLPIAAKHKYPHEFSGGQRQRVCIARALAVQPKLVICDESVSALDIKIQEQILELLADLQKEKDLTYLFITHDLQVVKKICNRIMVMERGVIVEQGNTQNVMLFPQEDYTKKLLAAIPGMS